MGSNPITDTIFVRGVILIHKYENIENFYNVYLKLQDIKRTGWVMRNVPAEKLETVADHTLQVVVLATTLCHEI